MRSSQASEKLLDRHSQELDNIFVSDADQKATMVIVGCIKFGDVNDVEKEEPVDLEDWCN